MSSVARFLVLFTIAGGANGQEPAIDGVVRKIAEVEAKSPWFWSPPFEANVPYTYEWLSTRRFLDGRGRDVLPKPNRNGLESWRTVRLERIALDWGSHFRCLMEDGKAPCSQDWIQELERQAERRTGLTAEDKVRIEGIHKERRERRRTFWEGFPTAFRFERVSPNEIRFEPSKSFGSAKAKDGSLLARITGRFRYDPETWKITRIEYEVTSETGEPSLPKGTWVEVTLVRQVDGVYLPSGYSTRRKLPKGGLTEVRVSEFSNYRRFTADTEVRFDP
jgi:hypothetical protein